VGALPEEAMNPLVAAAIVSITINPVLYRACGPLNSFLSRHPLLFGLLNAKAGRDLTTISGEEASHEPAHRAVVVGYGPIGQMVVRLLRDRGIEPTIIEMNIETARRLRSERVRVIYGDANQKEVLEQAGVTGAISLILSASGSAGAIEAIRIAREINPGIQVVARADFLHETESMRKAGANEVFSGEGEVALAMTDSILRRLGSTPEQLDESRQWIRMKLFPEA
jgi:monovalent cation:H+ antiporter-2, CPA2 family